MVRAWYMDNNAEVDKRQPHMLTPPKFVELRDLENIGVLYHKIVLDDLSEVEKLDKIRKERGYTYEDAITISRERLQNYDEKLEIFYKEHIHSDEEIRLVEEGSGYFDVRDTDDKWIRIEVTRGDLLILPAGIYHRFTLDGNNYIKARRFFVGEPVWTPINRPAENHDVRQSYLKTLRTRPIFPPSRVIFDDSTMVRAWYKDGDHEVDRPAPHMKDPGQFLDIKDLERIGILYFQILSDDYDHSEELTKLRKERNYSYEDQITIAPDKLDKFDEWVKTFWTEHMHCDEEIRLATDGSGYFDVRDLDDRWIRIELVKGDLIILPGGIYHRFTLDKNNFIHLRRYFTGVPVWTSFNRPADDHEGRIAYVNRFGNR